MMIISKSLIVLWHDYCLGCLAWKMIRIIRITTEKILKEIVCFKLIIWESIHTRMVADGQGESPENLAVVIRLKFTKL